MNSDKNLQKYEFKLDGLPEADGEIKFTDLRLLMNALAKLTERVTKLIASGDSQSKGKPKWLQESLDFTVKDLKEGSTIIEIDAPCLLDVADKQFSQQEFWREPTKTNDTALDLTGYALQEILGEGTQGDRYDTAVIDAALDLKKIAKNVDVTYSLKPLGKQQSAVTIKPEDYERISAKKDALPPPKSFTVSGRLEVIKHSSGQFVLELIDGKKLLGKLDLEFLEQADLKELWGREVTTEGMVSFKANGTPRIIRARRLAAKQEGDEIFQNLPESRAELRQKDLFPEQMTESQCSTDPMILWGAWEGNESIDELLEQLD